MAEKFAAAEIRDGSGILQDVSMAKFFEAADTYRNILSQMGTAIGFVLTDVDDNLGGAKKAFQEAPEPRKTMRSYVSSSHAGIPKLMWLLRGFEFFLTMLEKLFDPATDGSGAASQAYNSTLIVYHGWVVQMGLKAAMMAMPGRESICKIEGFCPGASPARRKELVCRDGLLAASAALPQVKTMIEIFKGSGRWETQKA
eukprot:CAMPEP_0115116176 /NCGR_PEP_ID=MMETSP0227-20121206/43127_1 /TAXON_ID=89957 /ORGANISM="Polarella glacialis, Strain CCMP 1383" /LENGTH=198 /DNA_ID=CAMNT_0002516979 /DNA_START=116 /DNA_END=712 /DNA_ORIENTATION=-